MTQRKPIHRPPRKTFSTRVENLQPGPASQPPRKPRRSDRQAAREMIGTDVQPDCLRLQQRRQCYGRGEGLSDARLCQATMSTSGRQPLPIHSESESMIAIIGSTGSREKVWDSVRGFVALPAADM